MKALDAERVREGRSLHDDFATRVRKIEAAVPKIEKLAEQSRAEIMENFHKRIRELLEELPVNEKRLYEEASSASQHGDISEEITRLRTHLEGLKAIAQAQGAGREVDRISAAGNQPRSEYDGIEVAERGVISSNG